MEMSEQIGELVDALCQARGAFLPIIKDKTGQIGAQRYQYATLDSVMAATFGALAAQGIAVVQAPGFDNGRVTMTTALMHSSGQWMRSTCAAEPDKPRVSSKGNAITSDVQESGKVITYLRRYALTAILGVTADEDLDGRRQEHAERTARRKETPDVRQTRRAQHDPAWESERAGFCARLGELDITYDQLAAWLEQHGRPRPSHMTADARRECMAWLTDNAERVRGEG